MKSKNEKDTNITETTNGHKVMERIVESVYKSVCPKGTLRTLNGKLGWMLRRAGKIIVSGRWDDLIPQSMESNEVFDGLVDDLCNGKCPIELTDDDRKCFLLLFCMGWSFARYGKEKGITILKEAFMESKKDGEEVVA